MLAVQVTAISAFVIPLPLYAGDAGKTVIEGRCQYPEKVAQYRSETTLILCDTVSIDRSAPTVTLDFSRQSWGSMARFAGGMSGNTMTVSRITLRNGRTLAATGTCRIFYRSDGAISVISCLAKAGSRPVAANFVPSRI